MKQYDMIKLNTEIAELAKRGIHKNCSGDIALYTENESLVVFYNPDNHGDYAFVWVENKYLDFDEEQPEFLIDSLIRFLNNHKPEDKPAFQILKLKQYDCVELLVEKEKYVDAGIHKGMYGTILLPEAHGGEWCVTFSNDDGEDIAELSIPEKELRKIK